MAPVLTFKKYANRRLYDTEKSVYVTLNQVADTIREGRDVVIIDARTSDDVTAFTLTQIVLEEAKNKNTLLPAPLLHLLIRYGDNLLGEFFEKYLYQIFRNFIAHKQVMDDQFKQWIETGFHMSAAASKNISEMNPFQSFFDYFARKQDKE